MTLIDAINLGVAIASIILGLGAVMLSVYFFVQAKNTESSTARLLGEIKQQTQSLERLSGKLLSQLTAAVTGPRPSDEFSMAIIERLIPEGGAPAQKITPESESDSSSSLSKIDYKILLMYHSGIANLAVQDRLPNLADLNEDDNLHNILDVSASTYQTLTGELATEKKAVAASPYKPTYDVAVQIESLVKGPIGVWRERAMEGQSTQETT